MSTVAIINSAASPWSTLYERAQESHYRRFFIYQIGEIVYDIIQKITKIHDVISTIDIIILNKVAELTQRFGLKVWQAEGRFEYSDGLYRLLFQMPTDDVGYDKFDRMMTLLGSPTDGQEVACKTLRDLDERLDQALDLAPKIRATSRS